MRPEKVAWVSYTIPTNYPIELRGVYKNNRAYLNYLGGDIFLSTIYRAHEKNTKVYKLSECAETFSLNYYVLCK